MTLAVFGGAVGIDELADATQTRPDARRAGVHTVVELELHGELAGAAPARVVPSLWQTCEGTLRRDLPEPVVTDLGGSRVHLEVPVDLGTHALPAPPRLPGGRRLRPGAGRGHRAADLRPGLNRQIAVKSIPYKSLILIA